MNNHKFFSARIPLSIVNKVFCDGAIGSILQIDVLNRFLAVIILFVNVSANQNDERIPIFVPKNLD
jgi:hypothetical protein